MARTFISFLLMVLHTLAQALPAGFVYLQDVAPSILQDMRYASSNNFVTRPLPGYQDARCILSAAAAKRLAVAQEAANKQGYSLKVYDCYRPKRAVSAFYQWSQQRDDARIKNRFYPREKKDMLFARGYISRASGHSRGSTVDISLVKLNQTETSQQPYSTRCYSKTREHIDDDSINMGTRFDCLDQSANVFYPDLSKEQKINRKRLRQLMLDHGFRPYNKEWWHFTLRQEPYPKTYFDFPVR